MVVEYISSYVRTFVQGLELDAYSSTRGVSFPPLFLVLGRPHSDTARLQSHESPIARLQRQNATLQSHKLLMMPLTDR